MGMFDTFLIDYAGKTREVQTKRFSNALDTYRPGDLVDGAPPGVRVYFIRTQWDEHGRLSYTDAGGNHPVAIFVVLVNGIFTASEVLESHLEDAEIRQRIDDLKTLWSDTARCMARWGEFLVMRQTEATLLTSRIAAAKHLIDYAKKTEEEKAQYRRFSFASEEAQRIDQGENVLDVLRTVLDAESTGRLWSQVPCIADALDEFRL